MHHIVTFGTSIFAKPRRLGPNCFKIAKVEFQHMLDLGHMCLSTSQYASSLHMVPKKGSQDWRSVGDYRALNTQTEKDKYLIPPTLDFTSEFHGTKILFHTDLIKAHYQIPIVSEDIQKTTICTP